MCDQGEDDNFNYMMTNAHSNDSNMIKVKREKKCLNHLLFEAEMKQYVLEPVNNVTLFSCEYVVGLFDLGRRFYACIYIWNWNGRAYTNHTAPSSECIFRLS